MSSILLKFKQNLSSLNSEQISTKLSSFYVSKGSNLTVETTQKAYKCHEAVIFVDGRRSCSGFGRSDVEARANAEKIALESVIDCAKSTDFERLKRAMNPAEDISPRTADRLPDLEVQMALPDGPSLLTEKIVLPDLGDLENLSAELSDRKEQDLTDLVKSSEDAELQEFLTALGLSSHYENFIREGLVMDDLKNLSKDDMKNVLSLPLGPRTRLYTALHPNDPEKTELKEQMDKLRVENEQLRNLLRVKQPPRWLLCPITKELMQNPVLTADGNTFEKAAITDWLNSNNKSPVSGLPLPSRTLKPNYALRLVLDDYKAILKELGIPLPARKEPPPAAAAAPAEPIHTKRAETRRSASEDPRRNLYKTMYGHHLPDLNLCNVTKEEEDEFLCQANELMKIPINTTSTTLKENMDVERMRRTLNRDINKND